MSNDYETLRWPTNLDREAILCRLVQIRESAQSSGLAELATLFANVENMPSAKIGATVIAGITLAQDKPEYKAIATQLEMLAVNLKNLK